MQCAQCGVEVVDDVCPKCGDPVEYSPKWYVKAVAELGGEKDFATAHMMLDEGLQSHPDSALLWLNGGVLEEMMGNKDAAIKKYQQHLKLRPNSKKGQQSLDRLLGRTPPPPAPAPVPAPPVKAVDAFQKPGPVTLSAPVVTAPPPAAPVMAPASPVPLAPTMTVNELNLETLPEIPSKEDAKAAAKAEAQAKAAEKAEAKAREKAEAKTLADAKAREKAEAKAKVKEETLAKKATAGEHPTAKPEKAPKVTRPPKAACTEMPAPDKARRLQWILASRIFGVLALLGFFAMIGFLLFSNKDNNMSWQCLSSLVVFAGSAILYYVSGALSRCI